MLKNNYASMLRNINYIKCDMFLLSQWGKMMMHCCHILLITGSDSVWFKLTVTEMTINGNKSNPLTVTVTVTEKFH